ncbi:MAG: acetate kinase [Candidatus Cloacimonetes bacterium]|nr:acetate kinase [Candidatus Cloacimonadota bacterium]
MKILVINCGSSSVKFQLINVETKVVLAEGIAEKIGESSSLFSYKTKSFHKKKDVIQINDHTVAIKLILDHLIDNETGAISSFKEIDAVGHRLVHGGEHYSGAVIIDDHVLEVMRDCIPLAPLHNPANILGVEAMKNLLPDKPQCGVFDTAFHQTVPEHAFLYAIPRKMYRDHKIRRYGFHGTSHKYVSQLAADFLGKKVENLKIISCHIGNGASITAIKYGKSVDTSMGFTPLEGLVMGTRCGDLDPAIPIYMMQQLDMSVDEVNTILNNKSGMLGLSEISNDMREIEDEILLKNNPDAIRAHNVYTYRIKKYIGAYTAVMNGLDVLIFTGGVGENMPILRDLICKDMDFLGIEIDETQNSRFISGILDISSANANAKVKTLKIPTNEELMIAMQTQKILRN